MITLNKAEAKDQDVTSDLSKNTNHLVNEIRQAGKELILWMFALSIGYIAVLVTALSFLSK